MQWYVQDGNAGGNAPRAAFSSLVGRTMMLRIMAGTYQKDSCPRLMVQTAENFGVSAVAVRSGRQHLFRCAVAVPHGPKYSADRTDSTVVRIWCSMSPLCGPCSLSGAAVEKTFVLPQLQLVENLPPVHQQVEQVS